MVLSAADAPLGIQQSQIADKRGAQRIVPEPPHRKESAGRPIKLLAGAGGNLRACNYDFARDNSHSSDLNAPSFCEDNILMSFFLFISTEMELFIYTREIPPSSSSYTSFPPFSSFSSPHSCLGDLGELARLIKQETGTKSEKNNRRLWQLFKVFQGLKHKFCLLQE